MPLCLSVGWIHIHDDNHSAGYKIWYEGAQMLPDDKLLQTQAHKRRCWDRDWGKLGTTDTGSINSNSSGSGVVGLVGEGALCTDTGFEYVAYTPLDQYTNIVTEATGVTGEAGVARVEVEVERQEGEVEVDAYMKVPALSLFDTTQAKRGVVFGCKTPLLTVSECDRVLDIVYEYHQSELGGVWGTVRHSSVKTTDVAVENIPKLRDWLLCLLHTRLNPMLAMLYPKLADGSGLIDPVTGCSRMRVHDSFIVRYDADVDRSLSLPEHCDTSALSIVVSLSSEGRGDYAGGGTWFEALGVDG